MPLSFASPIRRSSPRCTSPTRCMRVGLAIGAFGAATVLGSFLFGWPSIIAVIINYVKRGDARGTWLESHFTWQIRRSGLPWSGVDPDRLVGLLLVIVLIGFAIWAIGFFALGIWAIYRIAQGLDAAGNRRARRTLRSRTI